MRRIPLCCSRHLGCYDSLWSSRFRGPHRACFVNYRKLSVVSAMLDMIVGERLNFLSVHFRAGSFLDFKASYISSQVSQLHTHRCFMDFVELLASLIQIYGRGSTNSFNFLSGCRVFPSPLLPNQNYYYSKSFSNVKFKIVSLRKCSLCGGLVNSNAPNIDFDNNVW